MTPRDPAAMLERLQSVTAAFSRALSPREVARVAVTQGLVALGAASSALSVVSPDGTSLDLVDHEGMNEEAVSRFVSLPLATSVASCDAVRNNAPIFMEDRDAYATAYPDIAPVTAFTDGSQASLPLAVDGRVLGFLGFAFRAWRALDERERAFMLALAAVTAQALDRARLYAGPPRASKPAPARLAGVRVLVADDASDSRDLIRRVLEGAGASVVAVGSALDALRVFEESRPDVMVADIGMPGDDGYALMRWIRALEAKETKSGGRVRAVALTGYVSLEDRDAALAAGYEVHLSKPASPLDLIGVVAELGATLGRSA